MDAFFRAILTVGWVGRLPRARGTAGALAGLLLFWAASGRGGAVLHPWAAPLAGAGVLALTIILLGPWIRRHYPVADPPEVVLDEVAGIFLTFAGIAALGRTELFLGFLLFRVFDIWKPFPVCHIERLPGGWGIALDDLAAAVYANLLLRAWIQWGAR